MMNWRILGGGIAGLVEGGCWLEQLGAQTTAACLDQDSADNESHAWSKRVFVQSDSHVNRIIPRSRNCIPAFEFPDANRMMLKSAYRSGLIYCCLPRQAQCLHSHTLQQLEI